MSSNYEEDNHEDDADLDLDDLEMNDETNLRLNALNYALRLHGESTTDHDVVLDSARAFYDFLSGDAKNPENDDEDDEE